METAKNASYFNGQIEKALLEQIGAARYGIRAAVAWITRHELVKALCQKAEEGVSVEVLLANDEKNAHAAESLARLVHLGAEVHLAGSDYAGGMLMHHKFCVIDRRTVLTGSYNWTGNGGNFMENLVAVHDAALALSYEQEFLRIKRGAVKSYAHSQRPFAWLYCATPQVGKGQQVKVEWLAKNAQSLRLNGEEVAAEGSLVMQVEQYKSFRLVATGQGHTVSKQLEVSVLPPPDLHFHINKQVILQGDVVRLEWEATHADKVWLTGELGQQITLDARGHLTLSPVHDTQFTLSASNGGGESRQSRMLRVFKRVEISHIQVPMPQVGIEAHVGYDQVPLPSRFSLGHKALAQMWRVPTIRSLASYLKSSGRR